MRGGITQFWLYLNQPVQQRRYRHWLATGFIFWFVIGGFVDGSIDARFAVVTLLVLFGITALTGRLSYHTTDRALPQRWLYGGDELELRRSGPFVEGVINGEHALSLDLREVPLFYGPQAIHKMRPILQGIADARRELHAHFS